MSYRSLRDLLEVAVGRHADRVLVRADDVELTYQAFRDEVVRCSRALAELGVGKGDRVALLLPNAPGFLVTWMAAIYLGAVPAPINPKLKPSAVSAQIGAVEAVAIVAAPEFVAQVVHEDLPNAPVCAVCRPSSGGLERIPCGWIDLDDRSDAQQPVAVDVDVEPWDLSSVIFSSGTTGLPKAVAGYQRAYLSNAIDGASIMDLTADDCLYVCLPLFHGNPMFMEFLPSLVVGASVAIAPRFSASRFWTEAARFGATGFTYVGTALRLLEKQPARASDHGHSVRFCYGGGSSPDLYDKFRDRFGVEVIECYGLTESGGVVTSMTRGSTTPDGCGRARSCFEFRVVDEHDAPVPVGAVGEIVVRGRQPFTQSAGYLGQPVATLALYGNLWLHSGDTGRLDADGMLHFVGRAKETIRRRGETISANEVEIVLSLHPAVGDVAVVPVEDELSGEEAKAWVRVVPGHEVSAIELWQFAAERLPEFMVPRYIEFTDRFGKTESQKIQKQSLRALGVGAAVDREASSPGDDNRAQPVGRTHG